MLRIEKQNLEKQRALKDLSDYYPIIDMLEDNASKENFERELYYLFSPYDSQDRVLLSPCTPLMWQRAVAEARALLQTKQAPQLVCQSNEKRAFIIATNFVLSQYEYRPHVMLEEQDVFIDGGGFIGDTAIWASLKKARQIHSFEPSADNYALLMQNKETFGSDAIHTYPFGLGKRKEKVSFKLSLNPAASHIVTRVKEQDTVIQLDITDLDSWCEEMGVQPSFIKMDIEGAELDALKGARNTICHYKPKLAISLYHNTRHMLEIPQLIKKYCGDYRMWCKKSHPRYEFILFASIGA